MTSSIKGWENVDLQSNVPELMRFSPFMISFFFLALDPTQGYIWIQGKPSTLLVESVLNGYMSLRSRHAHVSLNVYEM